jgi:RNA-directed DNA polymerase
MSSGSYLPPPVKAVRYRNRMVRSQGSCVATIADRIAQRVVARRLEGKVEAIFHPDSHGYRPGRSALDAVAACRRRCWKTDWAIDLDVQAFFDSVDHDRMIKAVAANTDLPWVVL